MIGAVVTLYAEPELTSVRVFPGGILTVMVGSRAPSNSRAMRLLATTTSLQPDTLGQKDASTEPGGEGI